MTIEKNMIEEVKDLKAKMNLVQAIFTSGDGFDTVIVPKGTFFNKPDKVSGFKVIESPLVESGKIIFINSKALDYVY